MIFDILEVRIRQGEAYIVSTPKVPITVATNLRMTLSNPANSEKIIYMYAFATTSDVTALLQADVKENPTVVPNNNMVIFNQSRIFNTKSSVLVAKYDTSLTTPLNGTTVMSFGIPSGRQVFDQELIVIPPGYTFGINVGFPAVAANPMFRAFYFEE
jgi:hypothetical protein